nr:hypothetical protein [Tanacetum cinerariifolium]
MCSCILKEVIEEDDNLAVSGKAISRLPKACMIDMKIPEINEKTNCAKWKLKNIKGTCWSASFFAATTGLWLQPWRVFGITFIFAFLFSYIDDLSALWKVEGWQRAESLASTTFTGAYRPWINASCSGLDMGINKHVYIFEDTCGA